MDRVVIMNYCLGLLSLLLLQGVLTMEGRTILNPANHVFSAKEDTDAQNKIIALLLHKGIVPVERDDRLGLELASKLAGLEKLQVLKDDLELEREIIVNLVEDKPASKKRAEPCFWKYCV